MSGHLEKHFFEIRNLTSRLNLTNVILSYNLPTHFPSYIIFLFDLQMQISLTKHRDHFVSYTFT